MTTKNIATHTGYASVVVDGKRLVGPIYHLDGNVDGYQRSGHTWFAVEGGLVSRYRTWHEGQSLYSGYYEHVYMPDGMQTVQQVLALYDWWIRADISIQLRTLRGRPRVYVPGSSCPT